MRRASMNQLLLRRILLGFTGALFCGLTVAGGESVPARPTPEEDAQLDARAQAIHERVLTLDSHVDVLVPGAVSEYGPGENDRADLDKLKRGGIDAVAFAIAVGPGPRSPEGVTAARAEADAKLAVIKGFVTNNAAQVALALTAADVRRIHAQGKIAVIESFLNARSLGKDLNGIDEFYKEGVRLFGFVHAGNNDFADSSRPIGEPQKEFHGLSPLGKQAIAKLNRLGVIIDVSQLTPEGLLEVLKLSKAPVVASHSAARALVDNTRNLSDQELDAIKANGGVVQVTAFNAYLVPRPADYDEKVRALRARFGLAPDFPDTPVGYISGADALPTERHQAFVRELGALYPKASVKEFVDHIDYIAKRIGVDHLGIGTDFNHGAGVIGFEDESEAPNVTRELVRRGYDEKQIAKIWGGNFLRVFNEVEAVSLKQRKPNKRF
jgi:membrane dipeptidase